MQNSVKGAKTLRRRHQVLKSSGTPRVLSPMSLKPTARQASRTGARNHTKLLKLVS